MGLSGNDDAEKTGRVNAGSGSGSDAVSEPAIVALWRHRWIVISVILLGVIAGALVSSRQVPSYVSESRLLFEQYSRHGSSGNDPVVNDPYLQSQADLLMSSPVVTNAAKSLQEQGLTSLYDLPDPVQAIQSQLNATVDSSDGTIAVAYACPVAADSAAILNSVVESYRAYEAEHRKDSVGQQLADLQTQKQQADEQLRTADTRVSEFKKINPDLSVADAIAFANRKLSRLNDQLNDSETNYTAISEKTDALAQQLGPKPAETPGDASAVGNNPAENAGVDLAWVQAELNRASANVDALIAKGLPPTDPAVQDARAYAMRMHDKLVACQRNASYAQLDQLKNETALAVEHQTQAQAAFDVQKQVVADITSKSTDLQEMQDQLGRAKSTSDDLAGKINQVALSQEAPLDIRVLEKAKPAGISWAMRLRPVGIGAGAGLLLGLCISFGLHLADDRLRTSAQVSAVTGLPILGSIPLQTNPNMDIGLRSHMDPMSDVAEAARNVRTALFAAARSTPVKTILITSPARGDGKTTFAVNLATSMAQAGNRTLLIDANFGQQTLQQTLDVRKVTGFSNVLAGHITIDKAICRTPIERLEMLPSGQMPPNSEHLLNCSAYTRLIEHVCEKYQCVIIDGPALENCSDSRILSASADISLFVARLGKTPAKAADIALEQLLSVGARVLGNVVNGVHADARARQARARVQEAEMLLGLPPLRENAESTVRVVRQSGEIVKRRRTITGIAPEKKDIGNIPEIDVFD